MSKTPPIAHERSLLIVEDSRLARQELRTLLTAMPDWRIDGEAADVDAAVKAIDLARPDVLLLDIDLPGGTGFDVLDRTEHLPLVIFTTAFDEHAVAAFERNALDYLLKPIDPERLAAALAKAATHLEVQRAIPNAGTADALRIKGEQDMVFVRDGERCWFVKLGEISGFESCGNYAQVWFGGQRPLIARTLGYLEERLDPALFFRASRSHLINLHWVHAVAPASNEGYRVTLRDGHQVDVSRRQARVLRERLEL